MTELIPWLAPVLLKPALVLAAAAAIAAGLRRYTAAARHAVWTGAILATLALPALSLLLPPLRVPLLQAEASRARTSWIIVRPSDPATALDHSRALPRRATISAGYAETTTRRGPHVVIIAIWLAGVLALGARRAHAEVRSRRLLRRARPPSSPRLERLFAAECQALGLHRRPQLLVSDETPVPAAAGPLRAVVLLPASAEQWTDADLSATLVHELGHVRRRDCLFDLLTDLAAIAYWCNPALWLAVRRMRAESERACDDLVLARGAEPEGYAQLLLEVARIASRSGALPAAATTAMARPRQLESRLLAVLDDRIPRRPLPRRILIALSALGLLVAVPAAALTLQTVPWTAEPALPEPDRLADSVASPESERLPSAGDGYRVPAGALAALRGPDSALTTRLIAALDHVPADRGDLVRERAAWALAQARGGRLVEPLLEALAASDWRVQAYAAWALATARDPRAVPPLIALLDHPVWRLRAMAAYALREAADRRAIRPMTAALTDPAWQVRVEAVAYFVSLGGPEMAERVRARRSDRHVAVRRAARAGFVTPFTP